MSISLHDLRKDLAPTFSFARDNNDNYYVIDKGNDKGNSVYCGKGAVCVISPKYHKFMLINNKSYKIVPKNIRRAIGANDFNKTGLSNIELKLIHTFTLEPSKKQDIKHDKQDFLGAGVMFINANANYFDKKVASNN